VLPVPGSLTCLHGGRPGRSRQQVIVVSVEV
jgi:hypothetical protein